MNPASASTFRHLHDGPGVLVLANCWDAGSARLIASLGARALATSSAAVAWSHGYPDGDALPTEIALAAVREIARVIDVPLSVDAEGGYSSDPAAVADFVAALADAGAVGINLEDGSAPPELLAAKIAQIKRAGVDVFVNARTDVYLKNLMPPPARVAESLARAARYRDAGADGIFVPGVNDPSEIRTLASSVGRPLNVLAMRGLPPPGELAALGVRRLSAGSGLAQSAWARVRDLARDFLADGRSEPLSERAITWAEMNTLLTSSLREA